MQYCLLDRLAGAAVGVGAVSLPDQALWPLHPWHIFGADHQDGWEALFSRNLVLLSIV